MAEMSDSKIEFTELLLVVAVAAAKLIGVSFIGFSIVWKFFSGAEMGATLPLALGMWRMMFGCGIFWGWGGSEDILAILYWSPRSSRGMVVERRFTFLRSGCIFRGSE